MSTASPSMFNFYKSTFKRPMKKPDARPPNNSALRNVTNTKQAATNRLRLASLSQYREPNKRNITKKNQPTLASNNKPSIPKEEFSINENGSVAGNNDGSNDSGSIAGNNNVGSNEPVVANVLPSIPNKNRNKLRLASLSGYSRMTKRGGKKSKTRKSRK